MPLLAPPAGKKWPVAVFSHGLGGTRNAYSQFCGSLASHGQVVIVPEHRDMSAPITYVRDFNSKSKQFKPVSYRRMMEVNETARILRTFQLVQRVREIVSILKVLLEQKIDLVPLTYLSKPTAAKVDFDWEYVDTSLEKVVYSGHSFGAATAVATVKGVHHLLDFLFERQTTAAKSNNTGAEKRPEDIEMSEIDASDMFLRPQPACALVLLDPWLIPVYQLMAVPLLVPAIANMSQSFYGWSSNMKLVYQLLTNSAVPENIRPKPEKVHLFLTKPSVHHSQSDFALLFPGFTRYAFKLPECTFETQTAVMNMNVSGCVEFLREQGIQLYDVSGDKDEGIVLRESSELEEGVQTLSKGYLVAGGQTKGWSRLDIENDITVVDILEND